MSRIRPNIEALLSICELLAIRKHGGNLSITRNQNGWAVCLGDPDNAIRAGEGKSLIEALEGTIIPVEPKKPYTQWKPEDNEPWP